MSNVRLPYLDLFYFPPLGWKKTRRGQQVNWQRGMRKCIANLVRIGVLRLCDWDPKDSLTIWLETLKDMAVNGDQERPCCYSLSNQ